MGPQRSCACDLTVVSWPRLPGSSLSQEVADGRLIQSLFIPLRAEEELQLLQTLSGQCCLPSPERHTLVQGRQIPAAVGSGPYTSQVEFTSLKTGNQLL